MADISRLPDLLSRLDAKEFAKLLDPSLTADDPSMSGRHEHPGASLRDLATASARPANRGKRRKNVAVRLLSTAAAALLVAIIGTGVFLWTRGTAAPSVPPSGPAVAMTPVDGSSPVTATVRLSSTMGGTRVDLVCSYSKTATRPTTFKLIAYGPDDQEEQLGSWQAKPGAEFTLPAATRFARGSLSRLELVRFDDKVMLAYDVP